MIKKPYHVVGDWLILHDIWSESIKINAIRYIFKSKSCGTVAVSTSTCAGQNCVCYIPSPQSREYSEDEINEIYDDLMSIVNPEWRHGEMRIITKVE